MTYRMLDILMLTASRAAYQNKHQLATKYLYTFLLLKINIKTLLLMMNIGSKKNRCPEIIIL